MRDVVSTICQGVLYRRLYGTLLNVMLFTSTRKYGVHTPVFTKLKDSSFRFLVPKSTKYAKHIYRYTHLRLLVKYGWRLADIDQTHASATNSCKICCTEFHEKPTACLIADTVSGLKDGLVPHMGLSVLVLAREHTNSYRLINTQ